LPNQWSRWQVFLFIAASIAKIILLYVETDVPLHFTVLVSTLAWTLLFYLLFASFFRQDYFLLYCIVSIASFIDFLYFQNFGSFPSIKQIILLPQVGKLGANIKYFTNLYSLTFVADLIPVGFFVFRKRKSLSLKNKKTPLPFLFLITLFVIVPFTAEPLKAPFVFNRYGIYAYHLYDIFTSVIPSNDNTSLPKEVENPKITSTGHKYFGIAEGRNIIVIQMEAMQNFLVGFHYAGQEITPNLNNIVRSHSIYFDNYYQQVGCGNTADAEFITNLSLHAIGDEVAYEKYGDVDFDALPYLLKQKGYYTVAFHGNVGWFWNREKVYSHIGFDDFFSLEDFEQDEVFGMGLSDRSLFKQSVAILSKLKQPFFAFLVTLSSHTPFIIPEELQKLSLPEELQNTMVGNYLQAEHYADAALGYFIELLKEYGLYENSLIVIYGDHAGLYPYNREVKEIMTQVLGKEYTYKEAFNIPLVFHFPGSDIQLKPHVVGGQIDFLPTIMNIVGLKPEHKIFLGQDLLNAEHGFAALRYRVPEGSFIDDHRIFIVSNDGVLEHSTAYDYISGEELDFYSCLDGYKTAIQQIEASKYFISKYAQSNLAVELPEHFPQTPEIRSPLPDNLRKPR